MKKILFILAISLFCNHNLHSQMTFSVSPGLNLNAANFGYKLNRFVPFIGIQYTGANLNIVNEYKQYDSFVGAIVDKKETYGVKASILLPNIGAKYFFLEQEKLKAYGSINLAMPFISTRLDLDDEDLENDINDAVKASRVWGGEIGFGAEYFFSDQFSIGGEFGIRFIHFGFKESYDRFVFDPNTNQNILTENKIDSKLNISPTFSKISLNFYFGSND